MGLKFKIEMEIKNSLVFDFWVQPSSQLGRLSLIALKPLVIFHCNVSTLLILALAISLAIRIGSGIEPCSVK
jgi:hypothetical protein